MTLLPFLIVTIGGAVAVLFVRGPERIGTAVGLLALLAALVTSLALLPGEALELGGSGSGIATTPYQRLFLVLGSFVGLLLAVIGTAAGSRRDAPAVTLAILGTSALALGLPDARLAVLAATAGGMFGALLCIAPGGGRSGAAIGARALRATVVAGTMAIAATAWIGRDLSDLAARPVVFGLAYLAMALAVAIRLGVVPVHAWAARLTDAVPESALPLVTAWAPAVLAIVALAWMDASIAPLLVDLEQARVVVIAIALGSIVLASLAAWIQDDLEHIVGYAIVGDAAVVMLAISALDPEAWAPARMWILSFVVARSAFAAWAAAVRTTFQTGRVTELRGWAIQSPVLAVAFGIIVLASVGLPGLAAFDARGALIGLTVDGPIALVAWLGVLSPLAYYGRLLVVGVSRPQPRPGGIAAWRPKVAALSLNDLRRWVAMTWSDNRAFAASSMATLLAVLALAVSGGSFGAPQAAAGLPPTIEGAVESFEPGATEGPGDTEAPSDTDAPEPSGDPSFEPIPVPSG